MYNLGNYQTNVKKINETNIGKYIQWSTDGREDDYSLSHFLSYFFFQTNACKSHEDSNSKISGRGGTNDTNRPYISRKTENPKSVKDTNLTISILKVRANLT